MSFILAGMKTGASPGNFQTFSCSNNRFQIRGNRACGIGLHDKSTAQRGETMGELILMDKKTDIEDTEKIIQITFSMTLLLRTSARQNGCLANIPTW